MAQFSSKDVGFILVDGFNLLGTATMIQDSVEAVLQETTVLGGTWAQFTSVGVKKGALSQGGFYDDAAGKSNLALIASIGATRIYTYNLESNIVGAFFVGFAGAIQAKYERGLTLEKLHTANAVYNPSGPVEDGQVLHPHTSESTATGNTQTTPVSLVAVRHTARLISSASVESGALSIITTPTPHGLTSGQTITIAGSNSTPTIDGDRVVTVLTSTTFSVSVDVTVAGTAGTFTLVNTYNGGSAYLQVSALTLGGYTNLTVTVKHSLDNVTYTDLQVMTAVTAAPTGIRLVVASGTLVNRYLAAAWAFTGAGSGQSATFMLGFSRA
jgi:hypothetical protein